MTNVYIESPVMDGLVTEEVSFNPPASGTLVEGEVVAILKNKILVDLGDYSTGIISGQEAHDSMGTAKDLEVGHMVSAYVLEPEDEDGLVVLSLRKASQEKSWQRFVDAYENGTSLEVVATEANKGGLLLNIDGIKGFIPVSQLAPLHYPRVDGADSSRILARLQKLTGKKLKVRVLNLDPEGGKLILSEKAAEKDLREEAMDKINIGDKVEGQISGIVKFGIFVTFEGLEGLVHISEIAWGHVKDPHDYGKLGENVEVLIIGKEKDKISLSMKRLMPDPWVEAAKKYQEGTTVTGEISRVTPFGVFIKLDDEINGLIHVSEIADDAEENGHSLKVGDSVEAKVINIDADDHRVGLSIKALSGDAGEKAEKPEAKEEASEEAESEE